MTYSTGHLLSSQRQSILPLWLASRRPAPHCSDHCAHRADGRTGKARRGNAGPLCQQHRRKEVPIPPPAAEWEFADKVSGSPTGCCVACGKFLSHAGPWFSTLSNLTSCSFVPGGFVVENHGRKWTETQFAIAPVITTAADPMVTFWWLVAVGN